MTVRGFGGAIGLGSETNWGTAVSRTNWLRPNSIAIARQVTTEVVEHLGSNGATSTNYREHFQASDFVGGDISWFAAYDDSTVLMMLHALGSSSTAGAGPYNHTISLAEPNAESGQKGLTIEAIGGTATDALDVAEVFEGCYIDALSLSISAGGLMEATATIIGETSGGRAAAGTPSYSSATEYIKHHHAGQLGWNSANYDPIDVTISVQRGLQRRQLLGSKLTSQPNPTRMVIEVSATIEWNTNAMHAGYLAGTSSDLTLTFTGTGNNACAITAHNAVLFDYSAPVSEAGIVRQSVTWRCFADGTDEGLTMVFTNDNATATTN